jgi:hypothetical protein
MPKYEEWDEAAGGVLVRRIITDEDGNVIESWPDEPES